MRIRLLSTTSRHRLTGGFDIRRTQLNSNLERNFRPLVTFSGARNLSADLLSEKERAEIAALLGTSFFDNPILEGRDFMAVGSPSGFFQTQALVRDATIGLRYWQSGFFFSDQIQVVPNLALTVGVRYDYDTVPAEVNERIEETFQDPEVQKLPPLVRILDGRTQIYRRDSNNVAPYIALAWDPFGSGKTSIRSGYGIYYDQILGAVVSQSRSVFPSFVTLNFAGLGSNEEIGEGALQLSSALGFINPVDFAIPGTLNTYNTRPARHAGGLNRGFGQRFFRAVGRRRRGCLHAPRIRFADSLRGTLGADYRTRVKNQAGDFSSLCGNPRTSFA